MHRCRRILRCSQRTGWCPASRRQSSMSCRCYRSATRGCTVCCATRTRSSRPCCLPSMHTAFLRAMRRLRRRCMGCGAAPSLAAKRLPPTAAVAAAQAEESEQQAREAPIAAGRRCPGVNAGWVCCWRLPCLTPTRSCAACMSCTFAAVRSDWRSMRQRRGAQAAPATSPAGRSHGRACSWRRRAASQKPTLGCMRRRRRRRLCTMPGTCSPAPRRRTAQSCTPWACASLACQRPT
mmetsp:Transcript_24819/g.73397  ORF Transcript_24819/g.73397 Transcript_24819/m.73397 type:complete len:236 (-) Transcript_24819:4-711(-)